MADHHAVGRHLGRERARFWDRFDGVGIADEIIRAGVGYAVGYINNANERARETLQIWMEEVARTQGERAGRAAREAVEGIMEATGTALTEGGRAIGQGVRDLARRGQEGIDNWLDENTDLELENGQDMEALLNEVDNSIISAPNQASEMQRAPAPAPNNGDVNMEAARSGGGGGHNAPSKETPISIPPTITYGLQETHTSIVTATGLGNIFVNKPTTTFPNNWTPVELRFRLNSPHDWFTTTLTSSPTTGNPYSTGVYTGIQPKLYQNVMPIATTNQAANLSDGNLALDENTIWWWTYWKKIYEYYTVLSCEYEIIMENIMALDGSDMAVAETKDAWKVGTSGNKTPSFSVGRAIAQKGFKWHSVPGGSLVPGPTAVTLTAQTTPTATPAVQYAGNLEYVNVGPKQRTIIKGHFKPGSIKRNIQNDGDVRTWTMTAGGTTPDLREELVLFCYKDCMEGSPTGQIIGANFRVNMKWIVQFKDLREATRYPGAINQTSVVLSIPGDVTDNNGTPT